MRCANRGAANVATAQGRTKPTLEPLVGLQKRNSKPWDLCWLLQPDFLCLSGRSAATSLSATSCHQSTEPDATSLPMFKANHILLLLPFFHIGRNCGFPNWRLSKPFVIWLLTLQSKTNFWYGKRHSAGLRFNKNTNKWKQDLDKTICYFLLFYFDFINVKQS